MPESNPANLSPVGTAFVEHLRAFHESLPSEEQELFRQIVTLAECSSGDDSDVHGFIEMQSVLKGLLVATSLMLPTLVARPSAVSADGPWGSTTILNGSSRTAPSNEQPTITIGGGVAPGASTLLHNTDALAGRVRPDLAIVRIDGPSTTSMGSNAFYTATIRNDGAAADGNVEVTIGFDGVLRPGVGVVQGIGLSCGPGLVPATLTCRGGTLAPGQETSLAFSAHPISAGQGTINVSLGLSGNVSDSDPTSNKASVDVMVTP